MMIRDYRFLIELQIFIWIQELKKHAKKIFLNRKNSLKWPYIPDHPHRILKIVVMDQEKQMHS